MSLFDGFFGKTAGPVAGAFKAAKCKTLLKLTIPRIKLLRNRREAQLKQMRREIAKLLENGQEATARIRVEHIIREENMMAAQEIIELFCELIVVRLPIIEAQKECPLDLKEAISSICFAAPRCADLPELQQVQMLFAGKYGKEFVAAASELMPDCGVNRQVIELLSVRAPAVEAKMKLLKEIAEEHQVDWDPTGTESEFMKPHEDLLNGPAYLSSGSVMPPTVEKLPPLVKPAEPTVSSLIPSPAPSAPVEKPYEDKPEDEDFDLGLPDVPKATVRPTYAAPLPPGDRKHGHDFQPGGSEATYGSFKDIETSLDSTTQNTDLNKGELPIPFPHAQDPNAPDSSDFTAQTQHYIPFVSSAPPPPSTYVDVESIKSAQKTDSYSAPAQAADHEILKKPDQVELHPQPTQMNKGELPIPFPDAQDLNEVDTRDIATQSSPTYVEHIKSAQMAHSPHSAPVQTPHPEELRKSTEVAPPAAFTSEQICSDKGHSSSTGTDLKGRLDIDLQDILAAAQKAADRAEQAASEACAAAESARVRILDMMEKREAENKVTYNIYNSGHPQHDAVPGAVFDNQDSFSYKHEESYNPNWGSDSRTPSPHEDSASLHRLPSQDDDPYSFPNLFSSQVSNPGSGLHSSR